tara:strand:+ start:1667 stop:2020 length:354 start_codon:yes stop_codon:yes gene_type:complete
VQQPSVLYVWYEVCVFSSLLHRYYWLRLGIAQQILTVEEIKHDFWVCLQASPYRRRDRFSGFAAEAALRLKLHTDAAQAAYLFQARANHQTDAQLLVHALLQVLQLGECADAFQSRE